jgi:hypothetical protein
MALNNCFLLAATWGRTPNSNFGAKIFAVKKSGFLGYVCQIFLAPE